MATNTSLRTLHLSKSFFALPPRIRLSLLRSPFPRQQGVLRTRTVWTSTTTTSADPLVPAPTETSGPLLQRLPNRALPDVAKSRSTLLRTLPLFILICTVSTLAIFNYQKSSSSTVASVLYSLRTNAAVRDILGDEIYFASKIPWIQGELNPLQGRINIHFWVKGSKGTGRVKFVSVRRKREKYFETLEWSLRMEDGREIQLLEGANVADPMLGVQERLEAAN